MERFKIYMHTEAVGLDGGVGEEEREVLAHHGRWWCHFLRQGTRKVMDLQSPWSKLLS